MLVAGNRNQRMTLLFLFFACALIGSTQAFANWKVRPSTRQELKPGDGREVVAKHCMVCHDHTLITTPQMTRSQWMRVIREMIEEQGMEEPVPEIRQAILEYLVDTQGPQP